eukprot:m.195900 g.195900  ORF g.195900 m.195900 type:complete len:186 (+) comp39525_c0_seq8:790-1347(+)
MLVLETLTQCGKRRDISLLNWNCQSKSMTTLPFFSILVCFFIYALLLPTYYILECVNVNWDKLHMHVVHLKDIVTPTSSTGDILRSLAQYVESTSGECSKFVVQLEGTSLASATSDQFKKAILFRSQPQGFLDERLEELGHLTGRPSFFKAFCSAENETLIFPKSSDDELCRRLTVAFSERHREC